MYLNVLFVHRADTCACTKPTVQSDSGSGYMLYFNNSWRSIASPNHDMSMRDALVEGLFHIILVPYDLHVVIIETG